MIAPGQPTGPRVIVALDFPDREAADRLVAQLRPEDCRLKVGFELFTAVGPEFVAVLANRGFDVFLDLKFHDIPNTVARACTAAARLGVWMLNVHALGGGTMMRAAREAIEQVPRRPLLIGVTLLTSHSGSDLGDIGLNGTPETEVLRLSRLVKQSGLDGVVCSANEASRLRTEHGPGFCLVTPGVRLPGVSNDDQQRVVTPHQAIRFGAHYLVMGRPITRAANPVATLQQINQEILRA